MGKEYEKSTDYSDFIEAHREIIPEVIRITKPGGNICWQVGYHAKDSKLVPLDYFIYNLMEQFKDIVLRNRIIWTFGHGLHCKKRFSGRHELILWFTKGEKYTFNLDSVRVAQKYPGKRHYKGDKKGAPSGNPSGKNPSDVWDFPVVNANHSEKTSHPCQFPHAIAQRLILALTNQDEVVCDPFFGSGTTAAAAIVENRKFVGSEIDQLYHRIAEERCLAAFDGTLKYRSHSKPIEQPNPNSKVARLPEK